MKVHRHDDPASYLAAVEPLLLADEARHNLFLGLLRTLIDQPTIYTSHLLWLVEEDGKPVGAALLTPPHHLVLAAPTAEGVLEALSEALLGDGIGLPGVVGGLPEAESFARIHTEEAGLVISSRMEQGIYALTAVEPVPLPSGSPRPAEPDDRDLLLDWTRAFRDEAAPDAAGNEERARHGLGLRIAGEAGTGIWLWDDEGAVSCAGFGGRTPSGIRIGPVYTPPERRGRGYATGLVAAVSAHLLARGREFCFLYTDMSNPASNAIYRRIGYRLTCKSAQISFAR